jgi:hypothetical protein
LPPAQQQAFTPPPEAKNEGDENKQVDPPGLCPNLEFLHNREILNWPWASKLQNPDFENGFSGIVLDGLTPGTRPFPRSRCPLGQLPRDGLPSLFCFFFWKDNAGKV